MATKRGSQKLQANWHKRKIALTEADVEKFARLVEAVDVEIFHWWWKGQPADIDKFSALFHVKRDAMGDFIKEYQAIESPLINVHWFPLGIIEINAYLVNLTTPDVPAGVEGIGNF